MITSGNSLEVLDELTEEKEADDDEVDEEEGNDEE